MKQNSSVLKVSEAVVSSKEDEDNVEARARATGFASRHIGPNAQEIDAMLASLGVSSLDALIAETVPESIRSDAALDLPSARSEQAALAELRAIAKKNQVFRSFIGMGYADCCTPAVILRSVLENPGWYTQYTPYQPEISQGRLEALLNFQTLVCDLTALPIANASLLDEGTALAEAMTLSLRVQSRGKKKNARKCFVAHGVHEPSLEVLQTRAAPLGIELVFDEYESASFDENYFAAIVQYPHTDGHLCDYSAFCTKAHEQGVQVIAAADLLSLAALVAPGTWGADIAVGSTQRLGVPLGFGGPHAAYIATKEEFRREIPGRIVGVSKDVDGKLAYRLALQTREQHIKRERATSNICTAQVLLAVIASMYAVYHGPKGLEQIALTLHRRARRLGKSLEANGIALHSQKYFDTVRTAPLEDQEKVQQAAVTAGMNFRYYPDGSVGITIDETCEEHTLEEILQCFKPSAALVADEEVQLGAFQRKDQILQAPVFHRYHSETELLRYITKLQSKDLSLTTAMIPLGSCTMKLNAVAEMLPISWPEFAAIHPFAPQEQTRGYADMIEQLEKMLSAITGFPGISLQPNAGSQGEYAGLLVVREYFKSLGQSTRTVCLIPASAHGTNPASAVMAGMEVVVVKTGENGDVDLNDLQEKAAAAGERLAALMITYPSTHGVFEESIREICEIVHQHGGQVYMDGANLNAQVGLCKPAEFGIDVCHLNLHKTFCIPHGGGGPGVGPIGVAKHLEAFLPSHAQAMHCGGSQGISAVSSAPWGSAGILPIPWMYIRMMGAHGLTEASKVAILNANYIAQRLEPHFKVLYRGAKGRVAHECIIDFRGLKQKIGIEVGDIAKRLMDYGFHAPTVSFPVVETMMIEPTESESKEEIDRFCEALISISAEIEKVKTGEYDAVDNPLKNAPHPAEQIASDEWNHKYTRQEAVYPLAYLREYKFWPAVGRIDAAFGDRNFCCTVDPSSGD